VIETGRLRRSLLYVPASNSRAVDKARSLPCDGVILDLEDAIDRSAKDAARRAAVEAVRSGFGGRHVTIRINGLDTPWGVADLEAVRAAPPDAVLAPKVGDASNAAAYVTALDGAAPLWAMIETCRAVLRLDEIAGVPGLEALVFGANDLLAEMRAAATADRAPLQAALGLTVMAARAHGLAVFDGVFNNFADAEGLAAECAQGAAFGFDGKTLIHPSQIAACNAAFAPSPAAVARARAVIAAFDAAGEGSAGVLSVGGRMVERLHLEAARRLLAIHEAASGADLA
jgi:citrate lyase subunit beta/citryl-CoA lyase